MLSNAKHIINLCDPLGARQQPGEGSIPIPFTLTRHGAIACLRLNDPIFECSNSYMSFEMIELTFLLQDYNNRPSAPLSEGVCDICDSQCVKEWYAKSVDGTWVTTTVNELVKSWSDPTNLRLLLIHMASQATDHDRDFLRALVGYVKYLASEGYMNVMDTILSPDAKDMTPEQKAHTSSMEFIKQCHDYLCEW